MHKPSSAHVSSIFEDHLVMEYEVSSIILTENRHKFVRKLPMTLCLFLGAKAFTSSVTDMYTKRMCGIIQLHFSWPTVTLPGASQPVFGLMTALAHSFNMYTRERQKQTELLQQKCNSKGAVVAACGISTKIKMTQASMQTAPQCRHGSCGVYILLG